MMRVFLVLMCCCFCVADEYPTLIHGMRDKNILIESYNHDESQLALFDHKQTDRFKLRCSLLPQSERYHFGIYMTLDSSEKIIQNGIFRKLLLSWHRPRILQCTLYQLLNTQYFIIKEIDDKNISADGKTTVIQSDNPLSGTQTRKGKAMKFNKVKSTKNSKRKIATRPIKPTNATKPQPQKKPHSNIVDKPIVHKIIPMNAPNVRQPVKQPPKPGTSTNFNKATKAANVSQPTKAANVSQPTKAHYVSKPIIANDSKTIISAKIQMSGTSANTTKPKPKMEANSGWGDKGHPYWLVLTAVAGGVCALLLCLGIIIYRLKIRSCIAKASTPPYSPELTCHYLTSKDKTTIYSIPFEAGIPSRGVTGPRSDGNGEIHYAVLDILPSDKPLKNRLHEESPYAEVIPDVSGRLNPAVGK